MTSSSPASCAPSRHGSTKAPRWPSDPSCTPCEWTRRSRTPAFLTGCLRAPSNGRQAGTHASSSSRVDIRRLHVLQLPLQAQKAYAEVFGQLSSFAARLAKADRLGRGLVGDVTDRLAAGGLAL